MKGNEEGSYWRFSEWQQALAGGETREPCEGKCQKRGQILLVSKDPQEKRKGLEKNVGTNGKGGRSRGLQTLFELKEKRSGRSKKNQEKNESLNDMK